MIAAAILAASLLDLSVLTAGAGVDYATTKWALSKGAIEVNPIVRHSLLGAKAIGGVVVPYVGLRWLRSKGPRANKVANIALTVAVAVEVGAGIHNTRQVLKDRR